MLKHELMRDDAILMVTPEGKLAAADFKALAREVDPFIEEKGDLSGLMIYTESFPGWEDFTALTAHLKFIRGHHRQIKKVAAVTDGKILSILPQMAEHFVSGEVRHFDFVEKEAALAWLKS
ncbi:MAG: STAS/SEC14 domain-containing protein [Pseudomonadota bacterium]|nr:STAS/SEC14 domain-containing protein [Pseudomonadota bacterium]